MSRGGGFSFASGNLAKLLAVPKYLLGMLLGLVVPRDPRRWIFGSGIGVAEGALALARELQRQDPGALIVWAVEDEAEAAEATAAGFEAVRRRGWAGFRAALRSRYAVVTHGLGDVNRFGISRARIIHLGHGAPLKKLHLDSPVTTAVRGPAPLRVLLNRMYLAGAQRVWMYVAGSVAAAERLRSAYRVLPGRVLPLGDARDDVLAQQAHVPQLAHEARAAVRGLIGLPPETTSEPLVLYAPTWRDGSPDPAVPNAAEAAAISRAIESLGARLLIRSHPLGAGAYEGVLGDRVHLLGADAVRDITPLLGAFDAVITDYSSIAVDFALFGRPIVWFAPDLDEYTLSRGLYEPLEVTAAGRVQRSWSETLERLSAVLGDGSARGCAEAASRALARRFHAHPEGGAAARVLAEIRRLDRRAPELVPAGGVFFESFYGRLAGCNPLALDREIANRHPDLLRYWSVESERIVVPEGSRALLVGGAEWHAAREQARLLVVNDWLRFGFRRRRGQTVLQTWHGTMLKHLALGRPDVGVRTRLAILRERRRWSLMLSQNPHSTAQFERSYAFRGEILETGYPRDDRLARAVVPSPAGGERIPLAVDAARRALGLRPGLRVLVYAPTWRDGSGPRGSASGLVDGIDVRALAASLGEGWVVVARGHSRTHGAGGYGGTEPGVVDASQHPDANDVILAADLLVTDYSSIMFDAAVARVPMVFFVPDLAGYRDRERGFTFDFEASAPGPLLTTREQVVACARELEDAGPAAEWVRAAAPAYAAWIERFAPHDDGRAAQRVVDALEARGALMSNRVPPGPAQRSSAQSRSQRSLVVNAAVIDRRCDGRRR